MPKTRPPSPPGFRRQMVELVRAGRGPEERAREFDPSAQSIRNWVRQADLDEGRRQDGMTSTERKKCAVCAGRTDSSGWSWRSWQEPRPDPIGFRPSGCPGSGDRVGAVEIFRFVSEHQAMYPIATMCRVLGVPTIGYYAWRKRGPSARALSDRELTQKIRRYHRRRGGTYGAPRIQA